MTLPATDFFIERPRFELPEPEYRRLLGLPLDFVMEPRLVERAAAAREWFQRNAGWWMLARRIEAGAEGEGTVRIGGESFACAELAARFTAGEVREAALVAVSAGPEAEAETARLWRAEKPDEYFFLESYATGAVEHLARLAGARLCAAVDGEGLAVLPHYSPGYSGWDVADQGRVLDLLRRAGWPSAARLEILESSQLVPRKSLVAVFPLAAKSDRLRTVQELIPCEVCPLTPCAFRRAPYRDAAWLRPPEAPPPPRPAPMLPAVARYDVNTKALDRWSRERLRLETRADGSTEACFRYDGSTCSNMGVPLAFEYTLVLGPAQDGFPVRQAACRPAPGQRGHESMCGWQAGAEPLLASIQADPPWIGWRLAETLEWKPSTQSTGCLCNEPGRNHKWRLALQTLHYRLRAQVAAS